MRGTVGTKLGTVRHIFRRLEHRGFDNSVRQCLFINYDNKISQSKGPLGDSHLKVHRNWIRCGRQGLRRSSEIHAHRPGGFYVQPDVEQ